MRQYIVKDVLVGRNDRGEKYHLSVELVSDERERESVSHEKIKGFQWLSFHGLGVSPQRITTVIHSLIHSPRKASQKKSQTLGD